METEIQNTVFILHTPSNPIWKYLIYNIYIIYKINNYYIIYLYSLPRKSKTVFRILYQITAKPWEYQIKALPLQH